MTQKSKKSDQKTKYYFSVARQYLQLFAIAQKSTPKKINDEFSLALPKRMLLGFALEIYLKAWLRHKGVSSHDLQFKYGHKIGMLFADAQTKGLSTWPQLHDVVNQLGPQHEDFAYRYVIAGSFYLAMDYKYVIWVLCVLDEKISEHLPDVTVYHGIDVESIPV